VVRADPGDAGMFGPLRITTNLDRGALAAYCGAYAMWAEAMVAIQKYGSMIKSPSGSRSNRRTSPWPTDKPKL
jgi:phage terminase small subunit